MWTFRLVGAREEDQAMGEKTAVGRWVERPCGVIAGGRGLRGVRARHLFGSLLLACLLLPISSLSVQTACRPGLIDTDTAWRVADSPCIVDQSVRVLQGVTLTIQPGVVVRVNPGLASGSMGPWSRGDRPRSEHLYLPPAFTNRER